MYRSKVNGSLAVVGMAGIAALFLPFVYDYSPVGVAADNTWGLWKLALPFFLALPVTAAALRWIVAGALSRVERALAYFLGAASACLTLAFLLPSLFEQGWPGILEERLAIIVAFVVFLAGGALLIRNRRAGRAAAGCPLMAMQLAYLANAAFCLIGFVGRWQVGAYCVLATVVVYLLQIILLSVRPDI